MSHGNIDTELDNEELTCPQAAAMRGVNERTIRAWIEQGALPARKRGRIYLVRAKDLMAVQRAEAGNPNLKVYGRMTVPHFVSERKRLIRERKKAGAATA